MQTCLALCDLPCVVGLPRQCSIQSLACSQSGPKSSFFHLPGSIALGVLRVTDRSALDG
jgi:hypothetical protein